MVTSKDGTVLAVDRIGTGPAVVCVGCALNDRHSTGWVARELTGFTDNRPGDALELFMTG